MPYIIRYTAKPKKANTYPAYSGFLNTKYDYLVQEEAEAERFSSLEEANKIKHEILKEEEEDIENRKHLISIEIIEL